MKIRILNVKTWLWATAMVYGQIASKLSAKNNVFLAREGLWKIITECKNNVITVIQTPDPVPLWEVTDSAYSQSGYRRYVLARNTETGEFTVALAEDRTTKEKKFTTLTKWYRTGLVFASFWKLKSYIHESRNKEIKLNLPEGVNTWRKTYALPDVDGFAVGQEWQGLHVVELPVFTPASGSTSREEAPDRFLTGSAAISDSTFYVYKYYKYADPKPDGLGSEYSSSTAILEPQAVRIVYSRGDGSVNAQLEEVWYDNITHQFVGTGTYRTLLGSNRRGVFRDVVYTVDLQTGEKVKVVHDPRYTDESPETVTFTVTRGGGWQALQEWSVVARERCKSAEVWRYYNCGLFIFRTEVIAPSADAFSYAADTSLPECFSGFSTQDTLYLMKLYFTYHVEWEVYDPWANGHYIFNPGTGREGNTWRASYVSAVSAIRLNGEHYVLYFAAREPTPIVNVQASATLFCRGVELARGPGEFYMPNKAIQCLVINETPYAVVISQAYNQYLSQPAPAQLMLVPFRAADVQNTAPVSVSVPWLETGAYAGGVRNVELVYVGKDLFFIVVSEDSSKLGIVSVDELVEGTPVMTVLEQPALNAGESLWLVPYGSINISAEPIYYTTRSVRESV